MHKTRLPSLFLSLWLVLFTTPAMANAGNVAAFDKTIESAKAAMMADPQNALAKVEKALAQSDKLIGDRKDIARATALWLKIEANIGLNRLDAAEALLDEAISLATKAAPDSKLHGDLMRSKGAIAGFTGKASDALRHYLEAHRIFRLAGEKRSQAIALQDIGQIYWEAGDYERMLSYYDDAQEIYDDDPGFALTTNNNRGEAFRTLGRREEAERAYLAALSNARKMGSPMLETRILSNLALVQVEMGKLQAAIKNAALAEQKGANPEARDWLPFVHGVKASIAAKQGNDMTAASELVRLFAGVDFAQTDPTYKEFHKLGSEVYARLGQSDLAFRHLQAFQRLDSEARNLTASASSQLLAARFDSANQKTRIAQLKQGQLERDIRIERQKSTLVTALLIAALAIIVIAGIALMLIGKSRNRVRETNNVLTDVNAKLEFALKAKTDFLAMTSHEIRTPLNGIMGMTQVILADDNVDQSVRERMQLVLGAGQTMQSLVDDLLDVSKMENGGITIAKNWCDLRAILSDGVQLWQDEAGKKGLQLDLVDEGLPPSLFTDGGRVRQVVFNLLANAIKFTSEGRVRIQARSLDGENVEIVVEDSGIGIPPDQLDKIFEPFHQVDSAMSRQHGGAGLGLSICSNIVKELGGHMGVTSTVGAGSRFWFKLPVKDPDMSPAFGGHEVQQGPRILVVDGNALRLAKLKAVLEPHASAIVGSSSREEATTLLMAGIADLLIADTAIVAADAEPTKALGQLIAAAKANSIGTLLLLSPDASISAEVASALDPDEMFEKPIKASMLVEAVIGAERNRSFQSAAA